MRRRVRLAGARLLGKDCPPLKCELLDANAAEQLLTMLVTAKFRYDPDPISEALHYKRLMDEEGYSVPQISKATGVSATSIYLRMKLLDLDKEIQELIGSGKLPADNKAAEAFLSIPDSKARVMLAKRVARDGMTIKSITAACDRLNTQLKEIPKDPGTIAPALSVGKQRAFGKKVKPDTKVKFDVVRIAVKAMCEKCDIKAASFGPGAEPAWSLIAHAAEETCGTCDVRKVKNACGSCPGVDIVRRIVLAVGEKKA